MEPIELAVTVYKNRSTIKKFIKWLTIATCTFAFFAYLVVATVLTVISSGFKPPPKAVVSTAKQVKH
jgi:hypothetical protein